MVACLQLRSGKSTDLLGGEDLRGVLGADVVVKEIVEEVGDDVRDVRSGGRERQVESGGYTGGAEYDVNEGGSHQGVEFVLTRTLWQYLRSQRPILRCPCRDRLYQTKC